jgi:type II secretory pathway pseudopilin PulG
MIETAVAILIVLIVIAFLLMRWLVNRTKSRQGKEK